MPLRHLLGLFVCLVTTVAHAQNTLYVVPCAAKNNCQHGTPIGPNEYYNLSIESVCIDKPDTFWHNKLISIEVDVTVGTSNTIKVPVYKDRVGNGCHIGANGVALANFVPHNGQGVTIASSVYRSDTSDGLKKILQLATSTSQSPTLTNYASSALPYVGIAVNFANQAYSAFGQPTTPWLNESPSQLNPVGPNYDRFDLRQGYFVQYAAFGDENPADADMYVQSGDLRWAANDTPVRGGSVWILFKIQRIERRTDYTVTNWYKAWDTLLNDCYGGNINSASFKSRAQQAITLLESDDDYTRGDRDEYVQDYSSVIDTIATALDKTTPDIQAVRTAIDASRTEVKPAGTVVAGRTDTPTASTNTPPTKPAIVPSKLAKALRDSVK